MTTPNTLRRLNWLWKHRHTHDDDTLQEQITVIRETIERASDAPDTSGAYVHLWTSDQTIAVDGEALEFSSYGLFSPVEFDVSFPATEVTIRKPGYYNIDLEDLVWEDYAGGGTIQFVRIRDGAEAVVREFTSTYGRETAESIAHAIPCKHGDKIKVIVDHNDSSPHDLDDGAKVAIYLVDGAEETGSANVVDKITSTHTGAGPHTVTMTSAQQSGDLMLMFLYSATEAWTSYPSGWTLLEDNFNHHTGSGLGHLSVLYKVSDGTESDVTADTTTGSKSCHAVWVINSERDYSTTAPDISGSGSTGTWSIDPPSVSVSHGEGSYLSFALVGRNGGHKDVDTLPSGYSEFLAAWTGLTSDEAGLDIFDRRLIIAATEDPTVVEYATSWPGNSSGSLTVAVRI